MSTCCMSGRAVSDVAAEVKDTFPQDLEVQQEGGFFPSVLTLQLEKLRLSSRDLPKAQQLAGSRVRI